MNQKINEIELNGIKYIPKDSIKDINKMAKAGTGQPYVLIRTYSAGVHVGYLVKRDSTPAGVEVTLSCARRIWYWDGAASLSQLAMEGVKKPENCKFAMEVDRIDLVAIEIIPVTEEAQLNIQKVAEWKQ